MNLFTATYLFLSIVINDGATVIQRAEADKVYDAFTSFEFIFILHLMRKIKKITDDIFPTLQHKSRDIVNAMHLVSKTKTFVQKLWEDGWVPLLEKVKLFYETHSVDIPNISAGYIVGHGRSRSQNTLQWSIIFGLRFLWLQLILNYKN